MEARLPWRVSRASAQVPSNMGSNPIPINLSFKSQESIISLCRVTYSITRPLDLIGEAHWSQEGNAQFIFQIPLSEVSETSTPRKASSASVNKQTSISMAIPSKLLKTRPNTEPSSPSSPDIKAITPTSSASRIIPPVWAELLPDSGLKVSHSPHKIMSTFPIT